MNRERDEQRYKWTNRNIDEGVENKWTESNEVPLRLPARPLAADINTVRIHLVRVWTTMPLASARGNARPCICFPGQSNKRVKAIVRLMAINQILWTYFLRQSVTVRLTSCFTDLYETKQVNLLFSLTKTKLLNPKFVYLWKPLGR